MKTHLQSFVQTRLQSGFSARMAAKQLRTRRAVAHLHNGVSVTLRKRADTPTSADRSVSRRPKIEGRTERIARSGWDGSNRRYTLEQDTPVEVDGL